MLRKQHVQLKYNDKIGIQRQFNNWQVMVDKRLSQTLEYLFWHWFKLGLEAEKLFISGLASRWQDLLVVDR